MTTNSKDARVFFVDDSIAEEWKFHDENGEHRASVWRTGLETYGEEGVLIATVAEVYRPDGTRQITCCGDQEEAFHFVKQQYDFPKLESAK